MGVVRLHGSEMTRNLSSPITTLFWKFVFPIFWIGFASFGTYAAWFHPEQWRNGVSPWDQWATTAMMVIGTVLLVPHAAKMCSVRLDDDGLTISNYWRQAHVPFAVIADVEFRPMKGPPRVSLTFRCPTPLGRHVVFIPDAPSIEALVADLRTRARLHQSDAESRTRAR